MGSTLFRRVQMPEKLMRSSSEQTADMLRALASNELLNNADEAVAGQVRGWVVNAKLIPNVIPSGDKGCKRH